jgi:hypothetical protein
MNQYSQRKKTFSMKHRVPASTNIYKIIKSNYAIDLMPVFQLLIMRNQCRSLINFCQVESRKDWVPTILQAHRKRPCAVSLLTQLDSKRKNTYNSKLTVSSTPFMGCEAAHRNLEPSCPFWPWNTSKQYTETFPWPSLSSKPLQLVAVTRAGKLHINNLAGISRLLTFTPLIV